MEDPQKSFEDIDNELMSLCRVLREPGFPDKYEIFETMKHDVLESLMDVFKDCAVIKLRKFFTQKEYLLWVVIRMSEHFICSFIVRITNLNESKTIKIHKKVEEAEMTWAESLKFKSFKDFKDILESNERFDYSISSDPEYDREVPHYEQSLFRILDDEHKPTPPMRRHHHKTYKSPSQRHHKSSSRRHHKTRKSSSRIQRKTHKSSSRRQQRPLKRSQRNIKPKRKHLHDKYRAYDGKEIHRHQRQKVRSKHRHPQQKRRELVVRPVSEHVYTSSESESLPSTPKEATL